MSLTSAGNLTVSDNLVVNGTTTLGDALISNYSGQFSTVTATNVNATNIILTNGDLNCPNSDMTCNSLSSSGPVSCSELTSTGGINGYGSLNLTGTSLASSQIIQGGNIGNNILGSTTIEGNLNVTGNVVITNDAQGAFGITDGENLNMTDAIITQVYSPSNYTIANTFLATQFLGNITQTANNGATNNINSFQASTFNGIVTLLSNLSVNSLSISPLVLSYLNGLGGNIQTSLTTLTNTFANYGILTTAHTNTWLSTNSFSGTVEIGGQYIAGNSSNSTLLFGANTSAITNQTGENCWFSPNGMASNSGSSFSGAYNTGLGSSCGSRITSGDYNTIIGAASGSYLTTAQNDVFVGCNAGLSNTTGSSNTCVGSNSGRSVITNGNNTFIGYGSGFNSLGSSNSFLGYLSGEYDVNGSNNVYLGNQTGQLNSDTNTYTNLILIGNNVSPSVLGANNQCVIGSSSTTTYLPGNLNVTGNTNMANLTTSGTLQCGNLNSSGTLTLTQATVNGNLNVIGTSNVANLTSSGTATLPTISCTETATLSNISSNGTTTLTNISASGTTTLNTVSLNGNITANAKTITPTILSYIYNLSSNAQSQLNTITTNVTNLSNSLVNYGLLGGFNSWTNTNTFNNQVNLNGGVNINLSPIYSLQCGVWLVDSNGVNYPIWESYSSYSINSTIASSTYCSVNTGGDVIVGGGIVGGQTSILVPGLPNDADVYYIILPNYGLQVYANTAYAGTLTVNAFNNTSAPIYITPSSGNAQKGSSWYVYYGSTQLPKNISPS